jgi:YfiH family protein
MQFLKFSLLQNIPGLQNSITTRDGGVSQGEYSSLNLAYHVGDDVQAVNTNRRLLANELGYDARQLVAAQQVHGAHAEVVTQEYSGCGALDWDSAIPDCDALIVAEPNIPVLIQVADCAPILLVEPEQKVLAVVHAGWRGAVAGICSKTLSKMQSALGCDPQKVLCGIGPSLCAQCFEVGEEVAAQSPESAVVGGYEKPHLDLRAIIRSDLESAGVLSENIEVMNDCPRCNVQTFFSHRRQKGKAGRFGLVAWWQE